MRSLTVLSLTILFAATTPAADLERLKFNHPGLVVDLGVGLYAWPMPWDVDSDGDVDLLVSCPDRPYNGVYLFENPGGDAKLPVFKPARRLSRSVNYLMPSYVDGNLRVLSPGVEYPEFVPLGVDASVKLNVPHKIHGEPIGLRGGTFKLRHNQWRYADYDGDGAIDLIVAIEDWSDYGWDDAWDSVGKWKNGPLHGVIYLLRNVGTTAAPNYEPPTFVVADGKPVDTFGCPSPNFADFDGDGDLDLLCGEFLDGFTYFANVGTRRKPNYAAGRRLMHDGQPLTMDLEMIMPVAFDWDRDGDLDLIVGDEDGRVAFVEHTGQFDAGVPRFLPPRYFQQQADELKFGALATPCGFDWDGDGDFDIVSGNTAGRIGLFENLSGPGVSPPKFAAPQLLTAGGETIRILAGPNGSIQGPCEAKWGYTVLNAADWDHDGLPDLLVNSIWGKVVWYRNVGTRRQPRLVAAQPIEIEWPANAPIPKPAWTWWQPQGKEFVTQWRTTPMPIDWNKDGLIDLVMLDHEGYLSFFERQRRGEQLVLRPGQRTLCDEHGQPLRMSAGPAGKSGRRKLCLADWDNDGRLDLIADSKNASWMRQLDARDGRHRFAAAQELFTRDTSGHSPSSTVVDFNADGRLELLLGGEDGHLYHGNR